MTDELIERFEPYNDEGNREGYGEMEPCVDGGWVRFSGIEARILADAKIIEAAEELAWQVSEFSSIKRVNRWQDVEHALAVYRAALEARK